MNDAARKAFAVWHVTDPSTVVLTAATSASRARWQIHQATSDIDLVYTFTGWRAFRLPGLDYWAVDAPLGAYGMAPKYVLGALDAIDRARGVS